MTNVPASSQCSIQICILIIQMYRRVELDLLHGCYLRRRM